MRALLKLTAAFGALVLLMVGVAAAAHAYDLARHIYGPDVRAADLAFVVVVAILCFGGAHLCIRAVFSQSVGGRRADTRHDTTDAD